VRDVFLNARFTVQALTGVQRFAQEITRELDRILPMTAIVPGRPLAGILGHAWEQAVLPWRARGGVLVNLGNTAPLLYERQVVVIHDAGVFATPDAYSAKFRFWYRFVQRHLLRGRTRVVTVSAFSQSAIATAFGCDAGRITVIGEGAEHLARVAPNWTVLERNGLRPAGYVLAVGSLAAHKNLAALAATATMLAMRGMDLVVTGGFAAGVFGDNRAGPPAGCRFVGRVDDAELRALYQGAACFVFPSRYEGFGLPAVEAMTEGCPVVAARAGSLPEVCGDAAVYCDPGDGANIAQAVAVVLDDAMQRAALAAAGQARVAGITWAAAAARLRDAIIRCEEAP